MKKIINLPFKIFKCFYFYSKHFSFPLAFYKSVDILTYRKPKSSLSMYVSQKMQQEILTYLKKKYMYDILKAKEEVLSKAPIPNADPAIWQCWWQGESYLDGITRICTNSVKRNAKEYPVVLITWDNVDKYVKIPEVAIRKHKEGKISLTELTDIMRMNLLYQKGGLWIDTTVLVTDEITKDNVTSEFYTCKESCLDHAYVSDYRWNTSCMGGMKYNPLFGFVAKMFDVYWSHEDELIDYYLFDYLIELGYEFVSQIKDIIDKEPMNNPNKHKMQYLLNSSFSNETYEELKCDTKFFKLSRKVDYTETTPEGSITLYGYLKKYYNE